MARRRDYLWVAYSKTPPYLPVSVRDTAEELATALGTTKNAIVSTVGKYKEGKYNACPYRMIPTGGETFDSV